ncbi:MAG: hypothetical protein M3Q80_00905 [bacterium]|nr:hypothetical protein [bacterium]
MKQIIAPWTVSLAACGLVFLPAIINAHMVQHPAVCPDSHSRDSRKKTAGKFRSSPIFAHASTLKPKKTFSIPNCAVLSACTRTITSQYKSYFHKQKKLVTKFCCPHLRIHGDKRFKA